LFFQNNQASFEKSVNSWRSTTLTCEQPFKKQKEHQEKMKSKDFNGQRRSTGQKNHSIFHFISFISDFNNPNLPYGGPSEPRYYITFGDILGPTKSTDWGQTWPSLALSWIEQ